MSLKSAIELCRAKVSLSIAASTPAEMLAAAREAEFALTVLGESVENETVRNINFPNSLPLPGIINCAHPTISSIEDSTWPDGDSEDNPEAETPIEKRNREEMKNRGFYG